MQRKKIYHLAKIHIIIVNMSNILGIDAYE